MFGIRTEIALGLLALTTLATASRATAETGAPRFIEITADNRGFITLRADCELNQSSINSTTVGVFRPGADGNFRTDDDIPVPVTITYVPEMNIIEIDADVDLDAQYRVLVSDSVRGENGMRIDGEFNGVGVDTGDGAQGGELEFFTRPPARPIARFRTVDFRNIDVELFINDTPITVANFFDYANAGDWDNTFFHRSVSDFVIQGGGFQAVDGFDEVDERAPILNEPGISNLRGTIAMAKLGSNPNSATSQWFFNLGDNSENLDNQNGGFTVFGEIVSTIGLNSIDNIANLDTVSDTSANFAFTDVPVLDEDAFNDRGGLDVEDLVIIDRVSILLDIASDPVITFNMGNAQVMDGGGTASVMFFDVQGDPLPAGAIAVRFSSNGNDVDSITLTDNLPEDADVAISIESSSPLRSITDRRRNAREIMFIHSNVGIGSIRLNAGIAGANINGVTLPDGTVLPTDIDGDGSGGDGIAILLQSGSVGRVDIRGDVVGDFVIPDGCADVRINGDITDCTMLFGMTDSNPMLSVRAKRTENLRIDTPQILRQLRVTDVMSTSTVSPSEIVCSSILNIQTTGDSVRDGDFEADIVTMGGDGLNVALSQMRIAGDISDSMMNFDRNIGRIDARGDIIDTSITVSGDFPRGLSARELRRVDIDIDGEMGTIRTSQIRAGSLIADVMGAVRVRGNRAADLDGDFSMDITLTNPAGVRYPLTTFDVAGRLADCDITIMGGSRSVKVGGDVENVNYFVDGDLGSWTAGRMTNVDLEIEGNTDRIRIIDWDGGFLEVDDLRQYDVTGDRNANIEGNLNTGSLIRQLGTMKLGNGGSLSQNMNIFSADRIEIEGDAINCTIQINQINLDTSSSVVVLDTLIVEGVMDAFFIRTRGAVGDVFTTSFVNSGLYIGAQGLQAEGFPPLASDVFGNSDLRSFTCTGDPIESRFVNSYLIAAELGNVVITEPDLFNGEAHGISYTTLDGTIRLLIDGEIVSLEQRDGTFKAGEFEVRAFHQAPETP
ncbi:MAG: peptidylprolyl isomerase [Phycisphaerales bacterium]